MIWLVFFGFGFGGGKLFGRWVGKRGIEIFIEGKGISYLVYFLL